jgi:hypothetical protein
MTVEFIDNLPGRTVGKRNELVEFADVLRQNPNRWAKYPRTHSNPKSAYSAASAINHDKFQALAGPEFEATARKENDNVHVYVRYTGAAATPAAEPEAVPETVVPEPQVETEVAPQEPTVSYSYPGEAQPAESTYSA